MNYIFAILNSNIRRYSSRTLRRNRGINFPTSNPMIYFIGDRQGLSAITFCQRIRVNCSKTDSVSRKVDIPSLTFFTQTTNIYNRTSRCSSIYISPIQFIRSYNQPGRFNNVFLQNMLLLQFFDCYLRKQQCPTRPKMSPVTWQIKNKPDSRIFS